MNIKRCHSQELVESIRIISITCLHVVIINVIFKQVKVCDVMKNVKNQFNNYGFCLLTKNFYKLPFEKNQILLAVK